MRLKNKRVLVVGLGRSGVAATRFLLREGAHVAVTDQKGETELSDVLSTFEGPKVEKFLGGHPLGIFERQDLILLSPGVPRTLPGLKRAQRRGIPIVGEMGLAAEYLESPMAAVTGTNGKSTTSTLIHELLRAAGQRTALAGNIGRPLIDVVMEGTAYDRVVVEVSSFQLETVRRFRPEVAVILNITEDHLDRYRSFGDYVRAKVRITRDQTGRDFLVHSQDSVPLRPYLGRVRARKIPFSLGLLREGLFLSGGRIVRRWGKEFEEYPLAMVRLVGLHNYENVMASIAVARQCGVTPDRIRRTLEGFGGLPHRMQLVGEYRGIRYYDDSKGTNVDAVVKSISGFEDGKVILIAGGLGKGTHFAPLRPVVRQKVRCLLLIGQSAPKLARELKGTTEILETGTLEAAVFRASQEARKGEVVVLSPACASFDQFKNFEERGERFSELVRHYEATV